VKQGKQQTLEQLLAPGVGIVQAPKKKAPRKLPEPRDPPTGYALSVYRCQLVEERKLAVPRLTVSTPAQVATVLWDYFDQPDRELFVVLLLDAANALVGINTVAIGDHTTVLVSAREVFKPAILANADRIVVAHNHINGDVRPSPADKKLTRALVAAARALDIQLCDHVILGRTKRERFSFLDADMLPAS
jgi:DNA repair protein RadC